MSLYAEYLKERTGKSVLEFEDGFAVYFETLLGEDKACYIEEIYVRPSARKAKVASGMADAISDMARSDGCRWLLGSVCPGTVGDTASLKVLLSYGFELLEISGPLIMFKKSLEV